MRPVLQTSLLLSCTALLPAQTGPTVTLTTHTAYGVLATDGHNPATQGVPANTPVGRGLDLSASVTGAAAHTAVTPAATTRGVGVTIQEDGSVASRTAMSMLLAGTTGDPGMGMTAPHTILMEIGGVREMDGIVVVQWAGRADGATAACAIDLNGDRRPEFAAHAGTPVTTELPIHRTGDNFKVWITTSGHAHLRDAGTAAYGAQLDVLFRPGGGGGGCALTPYGDQCAGQLVGRVTPGGRTLDLNLVLTGSFPNAFGLVLVGPTQARVNLGNCLLLVEPAVVHLFSTDAQGGATHLLHVPGGQQIQAYLQDLVLDLTPPRVAIGTSNGLTLDCR